MQRTFRAGRWHPALSVTSDRWARYGYESVEPTWLNLAEALLPKRLAPTMQTTAIRAMSRAYSTRLAPVSSARPSVRIASVIRPTILRTWYATAHRRCSFDRDNERSARSGCAAQACFPNSPNDLPRDALL